MSNFESSSVIRALPDGLVRYRLQGQALQIEYLNALGEQLACMMQSAFPVEPGTVWAPGDVLCRKVFETGVATTLEYVIPTAEGLSYIEARYVPEILEQGQVTTILGVLRDVSGRRRVEDTLCSNEVEYHQEIKKLFKEKEQHQMLQVQQKNLLQTMVNLDPGGLAVLVGQDLRHVLANPAYQAMTPDPDLDPHGHTYTEVWPPQEKFRGSWLLHRVLETGKTFHLDCYPQNFGGKVRYFAITICRIEWENEPAVLLVLWDTTRLEEAYLEASQAADEAQARADEAEEGRRHLAQMMEKQRATEQAVKRYALQLESSNRDLQDFAFIASHDLQEPLRKIEAFGQRLAERSRDQLDEQGRDFLRRMLNATQRMQNMINDLLLYSRVTTRPHPWQKLALSQVLDDLNDDLEVHLERSHGKLIVEPLPEIEADLIQMRQLFMHLISNAIKYHRPDVPPVIRVSGRRMGDEAERNEFRSAPAVEIRVEDNGIGFDACYLERIFQPFERLHGRSEYEGTGMGLAICRRIVERHNGQITAESQPGEGSTFIITLPVEQPPVQDCQTSMQTLTGRWQVG